MLNDFEAKHDIEGFAGFDQGFRARRAIVDGETLAGGVRACGGDGICGWIDTGDDTAEAREWFRDQATAASDIQDADAIEYAQFGPGLREALGNDRVADEFEPCRADLMQRAEIAVRIPPLLRQHVEAIDFGGVEGG